MFLARYFPGLGNWPEFSDLSEIAPETTDHMRRIGNRMLLDEEKTKGKHTQAIAAAGGVRFLVR